MRLSLLGIALSIAVAMPASAQDEEDGEEFTDVEEPETFASARAEDDDTEREDGAAPEELPEGADLGPPLSERAPLLTPEEQRRARLRNYDPTEPEHPVALQLALGIGAALDSSLDAALAAHRYGESPLIFQGDVSLLARISEWLYLGGRLGGRGRGWLSNVEEPVSAGAIDAMAIAHARVYLGRVVDLGAILGLGMAWGGVSIERGGSAAVAPRLHGAVMIAFRVASGGRFVARFAWDWCSFYDMDRYGSDLELGGPSLAIGLEIRR